MDSTVWNCCRLCLSEQNLHPIFRIVEHSEKYTEVLLTVSGIKVEINDTLPQEICSTCVTFINESTSFRTKCENANKQILSRIKNNQNFNILPCQKPDAYGVDCQPSITKPLKIDQLNIKNELLLLKNENDLTIEISHLINKEFDDDFHIEALPSVEKTENCEEIFVTEILQTGKLSPIIVNSKKRRKCNDLPEILDKNCDELLLSDILRTEKFNDIKVNNKRRKGNNDLSKVTQKNNDILDNIEKCNVKPKRTVKRLKKDSTEVIDIDKTEKKKESIECEFCHKILTSKLSLRNHYKIHTGFDVVCEHCGKKFITRRLLLMHCRAKHGYEKTDKCSFCDYRASNAEQVKIHERLHTGEKPYVCAECNAGFHRKSSYLQHVAIHLPEKTVQCDQCPARFKSVTLMRIHKNRHRAAQYTFQCLVCRNSFARRRNAARHLQRVHQLPPDSQNIDRLKIS